MDGFTSDQNVQTIGPLLQLERKKNWPFSGQHFAYNWPQAFGQLPSILLVVLMFVGGNRLHIIRMRQHELDPRILESVFGEADKKEWVSSKIIVLSEDELKTKSDNAESELYLKRKKTN